MRACDFELPDKTDSARVMKPNKMLIAMPAV